jgi:hypothetical protein
MVILGLVVTPLSVGAADEEHPLKKTKVGDFATYNKVSDFGIGRVDRTNITYMVILNCDKENAVILKATEKERSTEKLHKIDLSKPFDANTLPLLERGGVETGKVVKSEKVETGTETLKIGEHEYECTWTAQKFKVNTGDLEYDVALKVWMSKDVPLGLVKLNWSSQLEKLKQKWTLTLELIESGNKK